MDIGLKKYRVWLNDTRVGSDSKYIDVESPVDIEATDVKVNKNGDLFFYTNPKVTPPVLLCVYARGTWAGIQVLGR